MAGVLPPLPGSEPLDKRVAAAFLVVTLALIAPSIPGFFKPTDRQDLADAADELRSDVRQLVTTIDSRSTVTEPYFRTAIGDIGERVAGVHEDLIHRPVDAGARVLRDQLATAADELAAAADALTPAYDDAVTVAKERAAIQTIGKWIDAAAGAAG